MYFRLTFRALSAHVLAMCVNSLMIVFIFRATGLDTVEQPASTT